ncbi:MAG: hypothetical protein U1F35_18975 [Steroidobacteraceae bacterium]
MLHPNQFKVNEAWIAFRLNDEPIVTDRDGSFHCMALMDAASCFLLGSELYPASMAELPGPGCKRLLMAGEAHKQQLPLTLFLAREQVWGELIREATRRKIEVVSVPESELLIFIGEARQSYAEHMQGERER